MTTNGDQASFWNEQAGRKWVANQDAMDAQLGPLGIAAMDRLAPQPGERVLDVGCGAGTTTRLLAERVRPGEVVGVDISAPLLVRARERTTLENVRFELGDAQTFSFAPALFDAVFSRFGVMFFEDPVAAFTNLRGALRPGGRLGFVCWRAMKENAWVTVPLGAAAPLLPEPPAPPPPDAPGPFAFADGARVREILSRSGFTQIATTPHDEALAMGGRGDADEAVDLVMEIGPLGRALASVESATERSKVRSVVREALAKHDGPGGVRLAAATWIVTARTPA
jgi:SAM-dependent methyltransferase